MVLELGFHTNPNPNPNPNPNRNSNHNLKSAGVDDSDRVRVRLTLSLSLSLIVTRNSSTYPKPVSRSPTLTLITLITLLIHEMLQHKIETAEYIENQPRA